MEGKTDSLMCAKIKKVGQVTKSSENSLINFDHLVN